MKIVKISILSLAFLTSTCLANVISYNGYTLNTADKIVSNGKTDWLQWSETSGMSVNEASVLYSTSGWRVASHDDMAYLFNSMKFNDPYKWLANEELNQGNTYIASSEMEMLASPQANFVNLFGITAGNYRTIALFGQDENENGYINVAYTAYYHSWRGYQIDTGMDGDGFGNTNDIGWGSYGVALVRDSLTVSIPEPPISLLFAFSLIWISAINKENRRTIAAKWLKNSDSRFRSNLRLRNTL